MPSMCVCMCVSVRKEACLERVQPLLIQQEQFAQHRCHRAAEVSGLE